MMNMHLLNRSGLAAIAAATAFVSTPSLAQDATPVTAEPAPIVADTPLPSEPANPPAVETDTLAPAAAPTVAKAKPVARATPPVRTTAAPAKAVAKPIVRTAAPVTAPIAAATPAAPLETPADSAMVAPLPEPVATPAPTVQQTSALDSDMLPIAGVAGLGILALAGAAFAIRRRRRDEDDVVVEQEWHEPAMSRPVEAPVMAEPTAPITVAPITATSLTAAPIAASAFSWNEAPRAATVPAPTAKPVPATDWIEAAKRGPTPDNPSASLKKRLARAAFFDRREKLVAAGKAEPVDSMAGLPDALDSSHLDEPQQQVVRRPQPAPRMSFNRRFQPA